MEFFNSQHDVLLPLPIPEALLRVMLFVGFEIHLLFALFTVGLALLAGWDMVMGRSLVRTLHTFFTHKSLAVVLGVGVLIMMLVLEPVPMLRGVNVIAPYWLLLVILLSVSLILVSYAGHIHHAVWRQRGALFIGGLCLVMVPTIFSAMVISVENPSVWTTAAHSLPHWPKWLVVHWMVRVLHVLGAAVVFAAALRLLIEHHRGSEAQPLGTRIRGAIWFQVIIGVALLASLPHPPRLPVIGAILLGLVGAGGFTMQLDNNDGIRQVPSKSPRFAMLLLLLLLTGMLAARQLLQEQVLVPVQQRLRAGAVGYATLLQQIPSPPRPPSAQPVYANPAVIYAESCSFCHGGVANGKGDEASRLSIPPEDLSAVRTSRAFVRRILRDGVPGTAMPSFQFYTRAEIEPLIDFLHQAGLRSRLEPIPVSLAPDVRAQAQTVFRSVCAACHGQNGRGGPAAANLLPSPPDLSRFTVSPERAFQVITTGYPGTAMSSFKHFSVALRWGLTEVVNRLYEATLVR